ncbi:MAG: hypothetical protein ACO4AD_06895, partial [Pseudomonadales bacterium]
MGNLQRLLIPGAVLQSVMIGGGYGTGREVVQDHRPALTSNQLGVRIGQQAGQGKPPPAQQIRHVGRQGK